jgi:DNA-directed RNA polymerase subunit RPC12/RpoP
MAEVVVERERECSACGAIQRAEYDGVLCERCGELLY